MFLMKNQGFWRIIAKSGTFCRQRMNAALLIPKPARSVPQVNDAKSSKELLGFCQSVLGLLCGLCHWENMPSPDHGTN